MSPSPADPAPRAADWEAFYRDYRKPGYVPGFEITSKLGGGMFGLVFRARRMSIGKDYAIKFLQVEDETVRSAVLNELEQVKYFAQIDHPNLVSIEDRGEVDGIPFLVMAFAGTETLRDTMPAGRVPTAAEKDELLRMFLQCCRGLSALHERSLVHFDIKPANVFLKGGVARLGDYGLSKLVTHSRGSLSMGRGTPYYMAPELLQRRGDARSDVYSLGVMLYEILCGKVPFTGDSEWEVLKQHETASPELPPHLTPRERAALQRCLAKDPAARYQSVHDLIAAFGAPASAGAAAWSDVRGGAAASPPPAPTPDAAKGATQDALAGLGRAGREALKHASTIAQQAAKQAGALAQQAAADAQRAVREAVERRGGWRRAFALGRLRRQHRDPAQQERVQDLAEAIAKGPQRRRRGGWWGSLLIAVGGLVFLMAMWGVRGGPRPSWQTAASSGVTVMPMATSPGERTALFRSFQIPAELQGHVSTSEPAWVETARRDVDRAREQLLAQIEQLRATAPLSETARVAVVELPHFEARSDLRPSRGTVDTLLRGFVQARSYDEVRARQLIAAAPASLVAAAEELARLPWRSADDYERACRLQRLLQEATGCRDLPVLGHPDEPLPTLAAQNRNLGALWLWFVNEFAHTPRTWQTYLQLMPPR